MKLTLKRPLYFVVKSKDARNAYLIFATRERAPREGHTFKSIRKIKEFFGTAARCEEINK